MMNNEMTNSERDLAFANWLCRNTDFTINEISRLCPGVHEFKSKVLQKYIGGVISWFLENHPQLSEKQL